MQTSLPGPQATACARPDKWIFHPRNEHPIPRADWPSSSQPKCQLPHQRLTRELNPIAAKPSMHQTHLTISRLPTKRNGFLTRAWWITHTLTLPGLMAHNRSRQICQLSYLALDNKLIPCDGFHPSHTAVQLQDTSQDKPTPSQAPKRMV